MLSIQAVRGLPRLRAPGIVPFSGYFQQDCLGTFQETFWGYLILCSFQCRKPVGYLCCKLYCFLFLEFLQIQRQNTVLLSFSQPKFLHHHKQLMTPFPCNLELSPMTFTSGLDQDSHMVNHYAKYLHQRPTHSTHRPDTQTYTADCTTRTTKALSEIYATIKATRTQGYVTRECERTQAPVNHTCIRLSKRKWLT